MAEHYTRNTTAVLKWCNTCARNTMHKVSGKRIGAYIEIHPRPQPKPVEVIEEDPQGGLFE